MGALPWHPGRLARQPDSSPSNRTSLRARRRGDGGTKGSFPPLLAPRAQMLHVLQPGGQHSPLPHCMLAPSLVLTPCRLSLWNGAGSLVWKPDGSILRGKLQSKTGEQAAPRQH